MLVNVYGAKCIGIDAVKVTVETGVAPGIGIHLVGLADVAVKESLLRVTTALESIGYRIPGRKIIINLAPADVRKNGSGYDLPIAVGIIAASEQESLPLLGEFLLMGELGLDASVRPFAGALPFAELARQEGMRGCIFPAASALEATEVGGISVYGVTTLREVIGILSGRDDASALLAGASSLRPPEPEASIDFQDIVGQAGAKRGVEIAAAGGHNVILVGSPGSGKSSLAKAMAGILPPMTKDESLLTSKIYSIAGKGDLRLGLIRQRPFRSPHYSASLAAIVGGGGGDSVMPGEISLASGGVLFLDEFGQMPKSVIEALRGPLEDRKVTISRLRSKVEYPASFMLVAASNPCPCGYYGEADRCTCTPGQRRSYLTHLSGPIMDRIDIQLWMKPVDSATLMEQSLSGQKPESSASVAQRVRMAREVQQRRFEGSGICTNAEMGNKEVELYCRLSRECVGTLKKIMDSSGFSMRAYFRIIKVARTIADLAGCADIGPEHLLEAAGYRFLDKSEV